MNTLANILYWFIIIVVTAGVTAEWWFPRLINNANKLIAWKWSKRIRSEEVREYFKKRDCGNCLYIYNVISDWCSNSMYIKENKTQIPVSSYKTISCKYWKINKDVVLKKIRAQRRRK